METKKVNIKDIQNIHYTVLSQGDTKPEHIPAKGEFFSLRIRETEESDPKNVAILAEYINKLGPYVHVSGKGALDDEETMRCNAKYDATNVYPEFNPIGKITYRKIIYDL